MILITGTTGFVGQNLLDYLSHRCDDTVFSVNRKLQPSSKYLSSSYDEFFAHPSQSATHYIHLAGKAHDLKKTADDQAYFDVNYELTKKLYDRFLQDPTSETFIFISSVKAAKDVVEGVLTEEVTCNPVTPYGKSKLLAEQYILSHLPENKRVYILRPCMIHGPGNKGNLNLLYSFASKGLPYPLAAFDNQRSFLSVENLCFVINQLMEKPIPSGIYQVADDETFSTNVLIRMMAQSLGKRPSLWKIPQPLLLAAAKVGDKLHLPLNSERLQKLTESYRVSNQKIKKALGVNLPLSGEEGLMRTFESFKGR